jgi:DNA helicase II / ATP-dependent DNA helicase PcrA
MGEDNDGNRLMPVFRDPLSVNRSSITDNRILNTKTMDYLNSLNPQQHEAVTAPDGPVLVLAGPGSGKTRVLTHRIIYLIRERRVAPWHIMALTFTNKAAREMRERVEKMVEGHLRGLTMGTFHSICARILRREVDFLPYYERNFVIFDTSDQQQLIKQVLHDLNLDDKRYPPRKILGQISNAKNELITPEHFQGNNYISEITKRVYARYQLALQNNQAMDFDDLLMNVVLLFDEAPDVLQRYQEQYRHILVDEFQDTNTAQYALLRRLAKAHGNIFAVGDSDQSIYKWRGADFRNLNRFRETYPESRQILLEQNYRSTQLILDAAKAVIKHNRNRVHKELFTEREGGSPIVLREAYNEDEEADLVIDTIQGLLVQGYGLGDCAVMYRTNAQSRALEEAFVGAGIPYRLVGATRFYQRREVKDVIAYLRLVDNTADSISFERIINTPPRGVGKKTLQSLYQWANDQGWQPGEALLQLAANANIDHNFSGRAYNALHEFGQMLEAWVTVRERTAVSHLLDLILDQTNYRDYLENGTRDDEEFNERWANVQEFRNVAVEAREISLRDFLEEVALVAETDNLEEGASAATLLTLHAAKGLEFPIVFITGVEENILPHSRSLTDAEDLAEERRLFYVGITRAMDRLYLSYAFRRTFFGNSEACTPSRFLSHIPGDLLQGAGSAKKRREQTVQRVTSWHWTSQPTPQTPAASSQPDNHLPRPRHLQEDTAESITTRSGQPKYKSGQKVRHPRFGEGMVIDSKVVGNDEEVHVTFPDLGVKKLAASFANLEIV